MYIYESILLNFFRMINISEKGCRENKKNTFYVQYTFYGAHGDAVG
jgi:hypothetical protein